MDIRGDFNCRLNDQKCKTWSQLALLFKTLALQYSEPGDNVLTQDEDNLVGIAGVFL